MHMAFGRCRASNLTETGDTKGQLLTLPTSDADIASDFKPFTTEAKLYPAHHVSMVEP